MVRWFGIIFSIFFGILIGTINALVWVFGYMHFVKLMLPYALFFVVLSFIVTAVLKAKCGSTGLIEGGCPSPTCKSVNLYTPLIIITGAIFIVFGLAVLATHLSFLLRTILAFIGSISFWVMLLAFVSMIVSILRKCRIC